VDCFQLAGHAGVAQEVRRSFGVALYAVQIGEMPPMAKPLRGFGGVGVLELSEDDVGGTYRAVYTVRFATTIYVLHVFQKKSKRGRETPLRDIDLIKERLKRAEQLHRLKMIGRPAMRRKKETTKTAAATCLPASASETPSRNCGRPSSRSKSTGCSRSAASRSSRRRSFSAPTQAQVSVLMRCKPVSVSVGQLMEFLTVLGQDIEVKVRPAGRRKAGDMSVVVQGA
jgi:phage-related protein